MGDAITWLLGGKATKRRVWVWLALAAIAFAVLALPFGGCYAASGLVTGEGYRDSTVRKLSHTGVFFKTWEAESLGDGFRARSDSGGATVVGPETFAYTVRDPAVIEQLQSLAPGQRVRIYYRSYLSTWRPRGETAYEITRVELLP